jgi:hypothetical protein
LYFAGEEEGELSEEEDWDRRQGEGNGRTWRREGVRNGGGEERGRGRGEGGSEGVVAAINEKGKGEG